jgi:hypothetical protein
MKKVLRFLISTVLVVLIILLVMIIFLFIKSKIWERKFQADLKPQYLVSSGELPEEFNERVEEYILSQESNDFLTLSPTEVGHILFNSIDQIVEGSSVELTNVYIEPSKGVWGVCAKLRLKELNAIKAWSCVDVTKDNIQTPQIYLENLYLQGINIGKVFPKLLSKANQGIAEAIITANENGFVGRVFENIEFLENELVTKGSLY